MSLLRSVKEYASRRTKKQLSTGIGSLVLLVVIVVLVSQSFGESIEEPDLTFTRGVELISVLDSSAEEQAFVTLGTVRSDSEAVLLTERAGRVLGVYRTVGSFVPAGTVIAEIENSSERASVQQAEGSVDQARANLTKLQGGTREEQLSILESNRVQAEQNLANAGSSARNTLLSVYATVDDSVLRRADEMFTNPRDDNPQFDLTVSDNTLVTESQSARLFAEDIIERHIAVKGQLSTLDLEAELETTMQEAEQIKAFMDTLLVALDKAVITSEFSSSDISTFKTSITTARTALISSLASIATTRDNLVNRQSALRVAEENLTQGVTGSQSEDIDAAQAAVRQAEGALAVARASLEKTFIRTPISGTINTLSLSRGDFVNAFAPAAIVSNDGGFVIEAFITAEDRSRVEPGLEVSIGDEYSGVVTSVAPGIDPATRKVKVQIGVTESNPTLVRGSSVQIAIRGVFSGDVDEILIPISALKVEPNRTIVFTIAEDSTLIAHEVQLGTIIGSKIVILEGITSDMIIVKDARGLIPGQSVVVN